jgi:nucleotide-binding universal stress UspA family protein
MIKDIVVNLSAADATANFAVSIAGTFQAHLAGISFQYEPIILPVTDMGGFPVEYINAQLEENEKAAKNAKARFDEAVGRAGISWESTLIKSELSAAPSVFARVARRFDLAVIGQAKPDVGVLDQLMVEGALFESGRPIFVVPYIQKSRLSLNRAMVCWDGSHNAARAISDALPLLARTKNVDVVTITGEKAKSDELPGADIAQHLARHGLKIELRRIVIGKNEVADTILSLAADLSTDFLVMGGYGHTRMREFILGGATRGILAAMTVPTWMSH